MLSGVDWCTETDNRFVPARKEADGKETFRIDNWDRPGGGGGKSRVLVGGNVFE